MPGRAKKSTKKFEKNHLKDTIDKRKEFAKIKQRQQIKAKKQARNAADYKKASDEDDPLPTPQVKPKTRNQGATLEEMTVDDFFQQSVDIPVLKKSLKKHVAQKSTKRKRESTEEDVADEEAGESDTSASIDEDPVASDDEDMSEMGDENGLETHKDELDALAEKDPEFYKYLKENDAELLDFTENVDVADVEDLSEKEEIPKKKRKKTKETEEEAVEGDNDETEVTLAMIDKWKVAMSEQHSLRAMRQAVLAFRAAAYVNTDDGKEYKYSISSPDVYHQLLLVTLRHVPPVLSHHLPAKESTTGKVRIATDSKKYRTLTPLLKSHSTSIDHLLENLSDAATIKLTLSSILPLLPYLLSFKKVLKNLIKTIITIWSDPSSTEATRITAFLLIRRLTIISDPSLRTALLKTTYQGLVKGSRTTNTHTLAGINLMKNSAAELWGLDATVGYTTAFTYIRQLAIHLRTSITHPTKDSYKPIYNWQYTHSLDFWSRVLSIHAPTTTSPFRPLIYPLVQITLGALRLLPTPTYFPLHIHLTRSLLRLSLATKTYIPLAPPLLQILQSPILSSTPKPSTLKPLDFATCLRSPEPYLRTRVYQDGLADQLAECLAEFFSIWAKNIAFPELVLPPSVLLRRWLKTASSHGQQQKTHGGINDNTKKRVMSGNRNSKLNAAIALLLQKLDANAKFVEERRRSVRFGPSDREGVERFLEDVEWADTPLGGFVVGMRARKEERERVLAEGRRGVDEGRKGGKGRGEDLEEGVGGDEVVSSEEDEG